MDFEVWLWNPGGNGGTTDIHEEVDVGKQFRVKDASKFRYFQLKMVNDYVNENAL